MLDGPAPSPDGIGLRNACEGDFSFLYGLHVATMKEYVEQTWGWDDYAQQKRYRETFNPGDTCIITLGGRDIGMLATQEREDDVLLALIEIDPEHQNRGIGRKIIVTLIADAAGRGKPLFLHVLRVNPAKALYERLGFSVVEETPTHFYMRTTLAEEGIHRD